MSGRSLLERARLQRERQSQTPSAPPGAEQTPSSPLLPSSPLPLDDNDALNPFMPNQALILRNQSMQAAQLKSVGERHLKRIKLEDDSADEYKRYLETTNKDERDAIAFLHVLQLIDLQRKSLDQRVKEWKVTTELAGQIKKFVRALLLLPNLRFYSGTVESAVMSGLRRCAVKDLPTSDGFDDDVLKAAVARQFSTDKSEIKKMLKDSTELADIPSRNIAEVTIQVLAKYCPDIQPTLSVYHRLCHIRARASKPHSNSKFWPDLDQELEGFHEEGPEMFVSAMQINYEDDIAKYGDPANTKHKVARDSVPSGSKKFLLVLHDLATQVQRVNSNGKRKRRHAAMDENEPNDDDLAGDGDVNGDRSGHPSRTTTPDPDDNQEEHSSP
ncbi:hypothetical protein B0H19DRAFT_1379112 [Mycena capillaripes]|nr:hypothetical protein B0H19DRAFT_1379112 [Mycena capillaripes]